MYLVELDQTNFMHCLEENQYVLLNVYQENCVLCEMMTAVLSQVRKNVDDNVLIAMIKEEYYTHCMEKTANEILPELLLFQGKQILDRMTGFRRAAQVIDFVRKYA